MRRASYARGWRRPERVGARVVSVGNLTLGGTGKTTLTRHLAHAMKERGRKVAVVCRRYRPGPGGESDEEMLFRASLPGIPVLAGRSKLELARRAAREGSDLVLVDDGFSHWALERDLDLVLIDARAALEREALVPAGRLREPWRALQRAQWVVLSRVDPGEDPTPRLAWLSRRAPGARFAAGRHAVSGVRELSGTAITGKVRVRVVTATGNPDSVARTAVEAGLEVSGLSAYRDHHWFSAADARDACDEAERANSRVLLTAKDAVRWPDCGAPMPLVLEVKWQWVLGGEALERAVAGEDA
jgi:tetraacyldisaccharide 4'-kinase